MPRPAEMEVGSCAESVERVPKPTSFSMVAWIRADEMSFKAAAILESAGWFGIDSWERTGQTKNKTMARLTASTGGVVENLAEAFELGMAVNQSTCAKWVVQSL